MKPLRLAIFLLFSALACAQSVRVWRDTAPLPTYVEGPPDAAPSFEVLFGEYSAYPYTMRPNFTARRGVETWVVLHLENEYLHCRILPDLGGHLHSCLNKIDNREMFYANSAIRKFDSSPRKAWVALGVEANFPVGHSRVAVSPVDNAVQENADGSASVWVGAIDRVSGMQWRAEFRLRPGVAALEENVYLYNRTAAIHSYYWWNNAAVRLDDPATRFVFPTHIVSTHEGYLEKWPVNRAGVDISAVAAHKEMFAMFAYGSREPFMGVYQPKTRSGLAHVADPKVLPGKKAWDWGSEENTRVPLRAAEDGSKYIEIQAGTLQNQETASLFAPAGTMSFGELWIPVHDMGGFVRANENAVLNLERKDARLLIEIDTVRAIRGAAISVRQGDRELYSTRADLDPARPFRHTVEGAGAGDCVVSLTDAAGRALLAHTENHYDADDASSVRLGAAAPGPEPSGEDQAFYLGFDHEKEALPWAAHEDYVEGLKRYPESGRLHLALGKIAFALARFDEALAELRAAASRLPETPELRYYLACAEAAAGNAAARKDLEAVRHDAAFGVPASIELGGLLARAGEWKDALAAFRYAGSHGAGQVRAGEYEVAALRHLGDAAGAKQRLKEWLASDPANPFLRAEGAALGAEDPRLAEDLSADPERLLDIADAYLFLGLPSEAIPWLERDYPELPANRRDAGIPGPGKHPLVAYYRGYCRRLAGQSSEKDFQSAATQPLRAVFPSRVSSYAVLQAALAANPKDAAAHMLLGHLLAYSGRLEEAVAEWQAARAIRADLPGVNAVLGRALLEKRKDPAGALAALKDAVILDPGDTLVHTLLSAAIGRLGASPARLAPADLARVALLRGAMGSEDALGVFTPVNFPNKQPDDVRAAYIELRLQRIALAARAHLCDRVPDLVDTVDEVTPVALTNGSFAAFTRTARFQYYLGAIAASCGDEKGAAKRWAKIKPAAEVASADFVFAALASSRLKGAAGKPDLEAALARVRTAQNGAPETGRGLLLFEEGVLLRALGQESEALARFDAGLQASSALWPQYWNLLALHEPAS